MRLLVTAMKNEGPFILEWAAYHLSIGVDRFLVYTNDCEDGSDAIWERLAALGYGAHERNDDIRARGVQKTALMKADDHPLVAEAEWLGCLDVDEFINVKHGQGTLDDLFAALPGADMIMLCWRRFGAAGVAKFEDRPVLDQFRRAAPEVCPYPFHNYGFKSLWRPASGWGRIGVHRPLEPDPARLENLRVVNARGDAMDRYREKGLWLNPRTAAYEGAQVNHYSLGSAESFLVKCDRGLPNSKTTELGLGYWAERNFNQVEEDSIQRRVPAMKEKLAELMADDELRALHEAACDWRRRRIAELLREREPLKLFLRAIVTETRASLPLPAMLLNPLIARSWEADRAAKKSDDQA